MANKILSKKEEDLLIADYHTNKYSQRALAKKYGCSVGKVNNLTKEINPENEHLVNAQISILSAQSILPFEHLNAIMNAAKDEIYNRGLAMNATQLNLIRINEHLSNNTKQEKINVGDGVQQFETTPLGSADYKNIQDAIDKATITLGINSRIGTVINNANVQQEDKITNITIVRDT